MDRAMATAKETRVTATMVAAMMANGSKDGARPHSNQLRGSKDNNSKGNEEDEGGKGNGDGSYGEDVDKRDHSSCNDDKRQQRQRESTQHNNQLKVMMGTTRAVMTRAAKAVCGWHMCAWLGCHHTLEKVSCQSCWPPWLGRKSGMELNFHVDTC